MKAILLGASNPHNGRMWRDISRCSVAALGGYGSNPTVFGGWLDDTKRQGEFCGLPILGGLDAIPEFVAVGYQFVNTISGSTVARYETSKKVIDAGGAFADFIHPTVRYFFHGEGTYCQDDVSIQDDVVVGENCAIHARTFIAHECRIGSAVFMVACNLMGRVTVGDGAYIGPGVTIVKDVKIGRWSTVGAGAVVLDDVPDYAVVAGVPARIIGENPRAYDSGALR